MESSPRVGAVYTGKSSGIEVQVLDVIESEDGEIYKIRYLTGEDAGRDRLVEDGALFLRAYERRDFIKEQADVIKHGEIWHRSTNSLGERVRVISFLHGVVTYASLTPSDVYASYHANPEIVFLSKFARGPLPIPNLPPNLPEYVFIRCDGQEWLGGLTFTPNVSHTHVKAKIDWANISWA